MRQIIVGVFQAILKNPMTWHFPLYTPVYILNVAFSLAIFLVVWRKGNAPGARVFALMLLASGFWSLTHLLEISVDQEWAKIFWAKVQYLGAVFIGPTWFIFTSAYSRPLKRIPVRYSLLLLVLPVLTILLTWTNEAHHLIWTTITPSLANPEILNYGHGAWFWVAIIYNDSLVLLGTWNVIQVLRAAPAALRSQPKALLLGAFVPILWNTLYVLGLSPIPGMDLTPFFLTFTGVTYLLTVFRFRLFDIRRVARAHIIENMRDGMLVIDEKNYVVDVNPSALKLLGISETIIEQDIASSLAHYPSILEIIRQHQPQPATVTLEGDSARHLDIQVSELNDTLGDQAGKLVVLRDVTERLVAEKIAFETAVEQERLRLLTQFIRDISHEFRTPLAVNNTSLYLMEKSADPDHQKSRRELIQLQVKRLDGLVGEMLTAVRLDEESVLERAEIDLKDLLQRVIQEQKAAFTEKQQQLILQAPPEALRLVGDSLMLQKALANILHNASRYTPEGGTITVAGRLEHQNITIEIRDSGIGMNAETKSRIFERFFRADDAHSTPGFGLGLSIAQTIIEKHHGRIEVESTPGTGSTFTVRLPGTGDRTSGLPAFRFAPT